MININTIEILHRELFYCKRIIKEALEVCKNPRNRNKDSFTYDLKQ